MKIKLMLLACMLPIIASAQGFAVLLAKDDGRQTGLPDYWPVQIQPLGNATNLPAGFKAPWVFATQAQVDKWKSDHFAEAEAYHVAQELAATQPKRDREAVIRQAIDDLKTIRDSNGTLTALQLSNAVRAIAKALVAVIEESRP